MSAATIPSPDRFIVLVDGRGSLTAVRPGDERAIENARQRGFRTELARVNKPLTHPWVQRAYKALMRVYPL